ncbi:MAG: M28 family metallopeptidase [Treponema sp.]|nr:M28 family metallopeptidase [Treponema sp.]
MIKNSKKNNTEEWANDCPYDRYFDFIKPKADRYAILLERVKTLGFNSAVITINGNNHIFIFPPRQKSLRASGGVFPFKGQEPYLFSAHYDRVPGSSGANDNSIAVFHLLNAALTLSRRMSGKWIIVFTDKEEIQPGESLENQGAFSLALKLKTWGLEKAKIFNFDACGTGDVFIISTTTDHILKSSSNPGITNVRSAIGRLRDHALATADRLRFGNVLLAPTPFSDDAGFLRAGLAAQTITMLPEEEAKKYETLLRSRPDFIDMIISGEVNTPLEKRKLPETWRAMNNSSDTPSRLTPQYFQQVVKFMIELVS